ncbi:MAG: MFS transporter [Erysipelotrichaceae bacterium]|nr:MFS transporter [Erysipelotrichaceae bacterium]
MKVFKQYQGLPKEVYILFFGRVVTNMGALIWPLLTMILSNKLQMSASQIANLLLIMSVLQLPFSLLGGKLADHFNKRNVIIVCDLVTVISYFICGLMEISMMFVVLFFIAGLFASMEGPSYDALIADVTTMEQREAAYSLNYLGMNLGLVLAPTIGGLLFAKYLNVAFLINSISTLSSTILIFLFIKKVKRVESVGLKGQYEKEEQGKSVFHVLKSRKVLLYYMLCASFASLVYSQFNFLLPLNLEQLYQETGAFYFGLLTSVNAFTVIVGTPLITNLFAKIKDVSKMIIGESLITLGFAMYIFIQGWIPLYFVSMIIFTFGEVFNTLGSSPYLTYRIPATHRGRISSIMMIVLMLFQSITQKGIGALADTHTMVFMWTTIAILGSVTIGMLLILRYLDQKEYPLLYQTKNGVQ